MCLLGFACNAPVQACPGTDAIPLTVTVVDSTNGLYVCNADITATSGSSVSHAYAQGAAGMSLSDASCEYFVEPGASGTYTINATAPGLHMVQAARSFSITYDHCGFEGSPQAITILMSG